MNGGLSVYMPRALQFTLCSTGTLNRIYVVPGRAVHDSYRRPRYKRKRDGTLVKPSSPPPSSYTPPQLNAHEYLYRWLCNTYTHRKVSVQSKRNGALVKPSSSQPPPPPPYILPQLNTLNTHEYLYTSVAVIPVDGCTAAAYSNQG